MASVNLGITGGTPPYSISVKKVGEDIERFDTFNFSLLYFTADTVDQDITYNIKVTDSALCSHTATVTMNCSVEIPQPNFNAQLIQPLCQTGGGYIPAKVILTDIVNAARYKICYNSVSFDCATCTTFDGLINGSTVEIPLSTPLIPTTRFFILRVYYNNECLGYKDFTGVITTPTCLVEEVPEFKVDLIQPTCSFAGGGSVQNGIMQVTDIINTTRYKICYDSETFTSDCESTCSASTGTITGNSINIPLIPGAEGVTRVGVVRFYNGSGCSIYTDHVFKITSPECSSNKPTLLNLDYRFLKDASQNLCSTAVTNDYDIYCTFNTPGVAENGQKSFARGGTERNVPNASSVPNVFITASEGINYGPGAFYRFQFNLLAIKSAYPAIEVFTFDVYARRITGTSAAVNHLLLSPQYNYFSGVAMVKRVPDTACVSNLKNTADATRSPFYTQTGSIVFPGGHIYNHNTSGYRKVATFTYNFTTGTVSWTNVP